MHHAIAAIQAGFCEVALIAYASRQRSRRARSLSGSAPVMGVPIMHQLEVPYGLPSPIGRYALIAARHMHQYGTTRAQLAEIAVTARLWAQKNPKAWSRDPLTIEDCLAARPISRAAAPQRHLPRHRWRRRLHRHHRRPRPRRRENPDPHPRRRRKPHPLAHQPDARPHRLRRCQVRPRSLCHGRHHRGRRRRLPALRQLHHHRATRPGRPRVLQEGRRRPLRRGRPPAPRRQLRR